MDPKDFILPSHLVDITRFHSVISTAVGQAFISPQIALNTTVEAGSAMRNLISPSAAMLGNTVITPSYLNSAYSTLASLREPYQALSSLAVATPYANTLNLLSTAGSVGAGVRDLYANTTISPSAIASTTVPFGTAAFQIGVTDSLRIASSVASPYLASSAAVFALDTSYAKAIGSVNVALRESILVGNSVVSALQGNVLMVSSALRDTWDAIRTDRVFMSTATVQMLRSPAIEVYTATQAAAAFSLPLSERPTSDSEIEGILEEAVDEFESKLGSLHQGLVDTYRGGLDALSNGDRDWQRHAMVSFRELSTHALHLLAPDSKILPTAKPADLHNGKPTRRARLNFIFAEIAGPEIAKFYDADMKAAVDLFELLNDGTHRLEQTASPEQVHYLRLRVVGLITSMLEAKGY